MKSNKKIMWRMLCDEYAVNFATKLNNYETVCCIGTIEDLLHVLEELAKDVRAFTNDVQYIESFGTPKGEKK